MIEAFGHEQVKFEEKDEYGESEVHTITAGLQDDG